MLVRIIHLATLIILLAAAAFAQSPPATGMDRAMELFGQRDWEKAAAAFREIEAQSPGSTEAGLFLGKSLVNLNRFSEAGMALQAYIARHPKSDEALYLLAFVRFRENQPADSLRLSTAAASVRPPNADDLKIVALDYVLLSDLISAQRYLEQALAMQPGNTEARYALGRVLYQQNQFDRAIAAFQQVLKTDPENVRAADNLGLAFEGKNATDAAIAAYRNAIEIDGHALQHDEQPYLNLGMLLARLNRSQDAMPLLLRAVELRPQSAKAHTELGRNYLAMNRLEDAERELQLSVKLDPQEGTSHYLLGRVYHRMGKKELATREFDATAELNRAKRSNTSGMGQPEKVPSPE